MAIRAIETVYRGYRFRSRLEARWAVFFDTLGVEYEYEKEGFDLDAPWIEMFEESGDQSRKTDGPRVGYYLPDFWLPEHGWFEIKPAEPSEDEMRKTAALAQQSGHVVFTLFGPIMRPGESHNDGAYLDDPGGGWDNCYRWIACPRCRRKGMVFCGAEFCERLCACIERTDTHAKDYERAVDHAVIAARSARFEHDERGR